MFARLTMCTSGRIYSKAKEVFFWRDLSSAHHGEYILNPNKLYCGATHQKHIIENISLIQTNNILARITRSTSPRIFSKSKPCCNLMISRQMIHAVIWRFHGRCPCCNLTFSWQLAHAVIWQFHGRRSILWFPDFIADGSCCNLTISR